MLGKLTRFHRALKKGRFRNYSASDFLSIVVPKANWAFPTFAPGSRPIKADLTFYVFYLNLVYDWFFVLCLLLLLFLTRLPRPVTGDVQNNQFQHPVFYGTCYI